jgi:hypothetical protein
MADIRLGNLNFIVLMGRSVREPELKYTPKGNPICNFSIAVNRRYQDKATQEWKDEASFFNCVSIGQQAERYAAGPGQAKMVIKEARLRFLPDASRYLIKWVLNLKLEQFQNLKQRNKIFHQKT